MRLPRMRIALRLAGLIGLVIVAFALTITIYVSGRVTVDAMEDRRVEAERAANLFDQAEQSFVRMRLESLYLLTEKDRLALGRFDAHSEALFDALDQTRSLTGHAAAVADLWTAAEGYTNEIALAAEARERLGFTENEGLEGTLREAVHNIENRLAELIDEGIDSTTIDPLLVKMLMMRRHEKDFMMRGDRAKYMGRIADRRTEFLELLAAAPMPEDTREELRANLEAYVAAVNEYAAGAEELAAMGERANVEFDSFVLLLDDVRRGSVALAVDSADAASQTETRTDAILLIFVAVTVVATIAIGIPVARGIARPVQAMTATMRRLAEGDTSMNIPGVGRHDEVGDMAAAVQVFKENMIRNGELAVAAAKEHESSSQRSTRIDRLTGDFDATVAGSVGALESAASRLQSTADSLTSAAEESSNQASAVAAASEQSTTNVQTVATATEELNSSIGEIGRQVAQAASLAGKAVDAADASNRHVQELADRARRIGEVVDLITTIAEQTNLLALNATIEAARAGDAGKGFAVVASEVKNLASQTAKATDDITAQINAVQSSTQTTVDAIDGIGSRIREINEITTTVASAVEEQTAATQEIARNVQQVALGTHEVSSNIVGVKASAQETGGSAREVLNASGELNSQTDKLKAAVEQFLADVRAA